MTTKVLDKLRRIKYGEVVACFCVPYWAFYLLFITFCNTDGILLEARIRAYNLIVPGLFLFAVGILLHLAHGETRITFPRVAIPALLLLLIHEIVEFALVQLKLISTEVITIGSDGALRYPGSAIPLIGDWLEIEVSFNPSSPIFSILALPTPSVAVLSLVALIVFGLTYRYNAYMHKDPWFTSLALTLWTAGLLRYIVDVLLYGGVHDFLHLAQFTAFDLGDIYIGLGIAVFLQSMVYNQSWQTIKKELFGTAADRAFFKHEWRCLKKVLKGRRQTSQEGR